MTPRHRSPGAPGAGAKAIGRPRARLRLGREDTGPSWGDEEGRLLPRCLMGPDVVSLGTQSSPTPTHALMGHC